jgi:carboxymethylenebutenolidase
VQQPEGADVGVAIIDTRQGPMRAILARPAGRGPFPAVITFPHVGGLTDTMRMMAEKVAAGGYLSVVPDLYHRLGTIVVDPQSRDEKVVAIRRIAAASVTDDGAMEDCEAVLRWLAAEPGSRGPPCATIGYGRGGSLAVLAAATFPGTVRAAASVLGFGFSRWSEEHALARLSRITGGVYCAFAELDEIIPRSEHEWLASLLGRLAIDARMVVHPGTRHPYVFPDRAVHDAAAAGRDWDAIFAMFSRCLVEPGLPSQGTPPST